MREMLDTVPTTAAGLLALLRLVKERQTLAEMLEIYDDDDLHVLLSTIATAATNIVAEVQS